MRRNFAAAVLASTVALTGCAASEPPPVSPQVQKYYDENVVNRPAALPTVVAKKVVAIGDTYSAGAGATEANVGFVFQLARSESWNLTNLARGGTGYLASLSGIARQACGLDYCPSYPEMIADAVAATPEIVLVAGGRNDAAKDPTEESAAIKDFYQQLRTSLPQAKIVALSPLWDSTEPPETLSEIAGAVRASVESVGGSYLDIGQPLQGRRALLAADGVHPNDAGHTALFEAVHAALQTAGL